MKNVMFMEATIPQQAADVRYRPLNNADVPIITQLTKNISADGQKKYIKEGVNANKYTMKVSLILSEHSNLLEINIAKMNIHRFAKKKE